MTEVRESFHGRPVLIKQVQFAFYHGAAFVLAQALADIPVILVQISHFSIVVYFMTGLRVSASAFFTYWVVIFATTVCITAMFRAIASGFTTFNAANKISGLAISAAVTYAGYIIYKPWMHPWFVWIYWIDPLGKPSWRDRASYLQLMRIVRFATAAYALEALMGNELHDRTFPCVNYNLIPVGPGYDGRYASCAGVPGSIGTEVEGDAYLRALSFSYSHVWRNFGIIWAWWVLFVAITAVSLQYA